MLTDNQKETIKTNIMKTLGVELNSKRTSIKFQPVDKDTNREISTFHSVDSDWAEKITAEIGEVARDVKTVIWVLRKLPEVGVNQFTVETIKFRPRNSRYFQAKVFVTIEWEYFDPKEYMFSCREAIIENA